MTDKPSPRCYPTGPQNAKILIVGEAPGADEIREGKPFVGQSGKELTDMLHQAGILRTECRITNVTPWRPFKNNIDNFFFTKTEAGKRGLGPIKGKYPGPEIRIGLKELRDEVAKVKPEIIIALGNTALWALTGEWGITKWRGSELNLQPVWDGPYDPEIRVLATYHPAAILRSWEWRPVACYDLSKAANPPAKEPSWNWVIAGGGAAGSVASLEGHHFAMALSCLNWLADRLDGGEVIKIAADIETRERSFIDCIGLAWSETEAICIPFFRASDYSFLWTEDHEATLILVIRRILTHSNARLVGQNWYYDAQYIARLWGFLAVPDFDTMVAHAVAYPGTPKSLDYLSSIYLPWHRYWKDDTAEAEAQADDMIRWEYNCKDCCTTWALHEPISQTLERNGVVEPWEFEKALFRPLMSIMMKGVRQDQELKNQYLPHILSQQGELEDFFQDLAEQAWPDIQLAKTKGAKPWYRSPTQLVKLLYEHLGLPVQYHKKTKKPTTDDAALAALGKKEPLIRPLLSLITEYRSLGVFLSTFILMPMDKDKRWRTSYNPVGTETFRFNSSSDPFGFGGNLQNIPAGDEK